MGPIDGLSCDGCGINPEVDRGERAGTRDEEVTPHVMRVLILRRWITVADANTQRMTTSLCHSIHMCSTMFGVGNDKSLEKHGRIWLSSTSLMRPLKQLEAK